MSKAANSYDVVIAGGGPAGASAAIHLAMQGARVLVAEQKRFPRAKLCGEFISPECLGHFARLGVMDRMLDAGGAQLTETRFYTRSGRSVNVPSEWFGGASASALGLSRAEMDARLLARARSAGVEVLEEAQAVRVLTDAGRVRGLSFRKDGRVLEVNSLVALDATGRARSLARLAEREETDGRRARTRRPRLVAFKAHLEEARGAARHCEIYFYRGGYGGLNRVENGLSNLCFIARARDVRACGGDALRVMREVLMKNQRAAQTLEHARVQSDWLAVALEGFGRRAIVPAAGLLAIGDAAAFIDPFTGSGMLMALESGELAARVVARHLIALRGGASFEGAATDYRALYRKTFGARLRVCAMMRRAAFVPRFAETLIFALGASTRARRRLARSTRRRAERARG
ncbi:MAG TPA: NAD(P)/FAD-dependent oxidoreductase [Pyrinomonadaceae bacterium]|nr:NAD(P)/FAD-dependent oxidoreductase [Pyrinomonadaceae bacterium]